MSRFAALAAALVLSSAGCHTMQPGCGSACGDACGPPGLFDRMGWTGRGCASECYGCPPGCGPFGSGCHGCEGGCHNGCLQNGLAMLLDCNGGCNQCGDQNYNFTPGPPTGQVAYPYYTVRGPRDFLSPNPPTIGPR